MKLRRRVLGAILLASATSAGCAQPPTTAAATSVTVSAMRVGLTEWQITAPSARLAPGPVALTVTNAGSTAHDLQVTEQGTGSRLARTPVLQPGQRAGIHFDATAGTRLNLTCTVDGHAEAGMKSDLTVAR